MLPIILHGILLDFRILTANRSSILLRNHPRIFHGLHLIFPKQFKNHSRDSPGIHSEFFQGLSQFCHLLSRNSIRDFVMYFSWDFFSDFPQDLFGDLFCIPPLTNLGYPLGISSGDPKGLCQGFFMIFFLYFVMYSFYWYYPGMLSGIFSGIPSGIPPDISSLIPLWIPIGISTYQRFFLGFVQRLILGFFHWFYLGFL